MCRTSFSDQRPGHGDQRRAIAPAREILGVETINVVADRGYFKIEDVEAAAPFLLFRRLLCLSGAAAFPCRSPKKR
jgi:hypothetical protein